MKMKNYVLKTLAYNKQVRIFFLENTDMIKEICNHGNISKSLKTALGKTVSIATLLSGTLKGNQRVSIKINASNRNYKLFADVDSMGNIRGYINDALLNTPLDNKNKLSVEELIGDKGYIQVLKDLGMHSIFTGTTDMPYGNIVDDFSYYFKQSEQTDSFFSVNMVYDGNGEIALCRGIMAQLLPGAPSILIDTIKEIISENQTILGESENFKEIPYLLFRDIEVVEQFPVQFLCGCSKEVFYPMLYSLNKEELVEAYKSEKPMEIVCNVCGKKYSFSSQEIKGLVQ
ncbi:Hsp33 family molecular chaperone HslO [Neobacillus sp. PS3-40]|uniref:Hsp33 family molecular chaperone HslO n=1 Tax=Neobacillus sp. PS3-40 TaxID=3070679 RepID=UPI0027E104C1|nr:Hsp33 family molecular chaperone HslO [Neobacillus sp. PS3-40]WML42791.1 Hsp33 family molecular chaperone HslO [Neobacillus sp. PS3-40]